MLADEIPLAGHKGYRGDLDVSGGMILIYYFISVLILNRQHDGDARALQKDRYLRAHVPRVDVAPHS